MNQSTAWYAELRKPNWAPPARVFGPVWTLLYLGIAISYGFIAYEYFVKGMPGVLALPFILNLAFNLAYSPIQFKYKNLSLATVDILLVLITLVLALRGIYEFFPWVTFINLPYLAWVIFAAVLQIDIMFLNWQK